MKFTGPGISQCFLKRILRACMPLPCHLRLWRWVDGGLGGSVWESRPAAGEFIILFYFFRQVTWTNDFGKRVLTCAKVAFKNEGENGRAVIVSRLFYLLLFFFQSFPNWFLASFDDNDFMKWNVTGVQIAQEDGCWRPIGQPFDCPFFVRIFFFFSFSFRIKKWLEK